jgi:uncharacterized membrane protein HdeD (DUF308 family)
LKEEIVNDIATSPTTHRGPATSALSRLYFVRFVFALLWAAAMLALSSQLTPVVVTLLVVYPAFDVAAAAVDSRLSRSSGVPAGLYVNMAISTLAAVGVGFAAADGIPAVLRVWGVWAVVSGAVQLVVGVGRRKVAGHWPMILSGSISVLAGVSFCLGSLDPVPSLQKICGYALLGGLFFVASAMRLRFGSKNG